MGDVGIVGFGGNGGKEGDVGCRICGRYIKNPTESFGDFCIGLHWVQLCF